MPPQPTSDISLRHLPDLSQSDASLSFQIPAGAVSADLLLADDSDFLNAVEDSFGTLAPPKIPPGDHMTLSQLTPKPRTSRSPMLLPLQLPSPSLLPAPNTKSPDISRARISPKTGQHYHEIEQRSIRNCTEVVDSPVNAERFAILKAEVESLISDSVVVATPNSLEPHPQTAKPRPKMKSTVVVGGGLSKHTRNKLPRSGFARDIGAASRLVKTAHPATQRVIRPTTSCDQETQEIKTSMADDEDNLSLQSGGGAAARLLMFSRKLMMPSIGPSNSADIECQQDDAREPVPIPPSPSLSLTSRDNEPLTLSQLSPRKMENPEVTQPPAHRSPTPARTASKRPLSAASASSVPRKKGKTVATAPVRRSSKPGALASLQKNVPAPNNTKLSRISHHGKPRLGPQALLSGKHMIKRKKTPVASGSHQPQDLIENNDQGNSKQFKPRNCRKPDDQQVVHLPPTNPTKPTEQIFPSELQLDVHQIELNERLLNSETERRAKLQKSIPNFKALHAAELQASIAFRQAHIAPTVPISPELNTEFRAKEREKFEELMRRKVEEMDRVKETKRKEREAEEERELKELRKKTIPKANEVPEWYAAAPRRVGSVRAED